MARQVVNVPEMRLLILDDRGVHLGAIGRSCATPGGCSSACAFSAGSPPMPVRPSAAPSGPRANTITGGSRQVFEQTSGGDGNLADTARFAVFADQTGSSHLVCDGSSAARIDGRSLAGVFIAAVD